MKSSVLEESTGVENDLHVEELRKRSHASEMKVSLLTAERDSVLIMTSAGCDTNIHNIRNSRLVVAKDSDWQANAMIQTISA